MVELSWWTLIPGLARLSKLVYRIYQITQYPQFEFHKTILCWHQGKLINYFTLASRRHEALSKLVSQKQPQKKEHQLLDKIKTLESFLDDTIHDVVFPISLLSVRLYKFIR